MPAWVLPDHVADVLPSEALHIERFRRDLLDTAQTYGYELVIPPLLEHLDSLLTGAGETLDLQTFKLVDQLSGRSLGVRADTTSQVARIDAHLLNCSGVTRLCYCGPVLHALPERPYATREPLQFGAEIYGSAGLEADLEIVQLAQDCLVTAGVQSTTIDFADVRIVRMLLADVAASVQLTSRIHAALAAKDSSELKFLTKDFPVSSREGLFALLHLYGDATVLFEARRIFKHFDGINCILAELMWIADHLESTPVTFDLADLRGYAYHSGIKFAIYVSGASDAMVRGGRYDEVGAAFGRNRPAAGFSMDVKQLLDVVASSIPKAAIKVPWGLDPELRLAVAALRAAGETVVSVLPGYEGEMSKSQGCRELVQVAGLWVIRAT